MNNIMKTKKQILQRYDNIHESKNLPNKNEKEVFLKVKFI